MRVKICGITNIEDAIVASMAGADALGFVFYKNSPRFLSPQRAKDIIANTPPFIERVGLFVDCNSTQINQISSLANISLAQIHFDFNNYEELNIKHLKVIRATCKDDILKYKDEYVIVDAFVDEFGGVGKRVNLDWFRDIDCSKIILAGGLNSSNLKELKGFDFYGVDVSSGVEKSKGVKDRDKLREFIQTAKSL